MNGLRRTARALEAVAWRGGKRLDGALEQVAARIVEHGGSMRGPVNCSNSRNSFVHVTGIGKSALVGQRLAASLRSLSVLSGFTHASEWRHGCLGALRGGDTVLVFSHSGTTHECVEACAAIKASRHGQDVGIVGVYSSKALQQTDHVAKYCDVVVEYNLGKEGADTSAAFDDMLGGCCPTTSIVVQEALSNALLEAVIELKGTTCAEFKRNHPA